MSNDPSKRTSMTSSSTKPDPFPGEEETEEEKHMDNQEEARRIQELLEQAEAIRAADALVQLSNEQGIEEQGNEGDVDEGGDDEGDGDDAEERETSEDDGRRTV
jgi:hypothetical protein